MRDKMIERDKIYVINTNDLTQIKCFPIGETVADKIALYLIGKRVSLFLLCRPGYNSIFLKSYRHSEMIREIKRWLDQTVSVRFKHIGKMKHMPYPLEDKEQS